MVGIDLRKLADVPARRDLHDRRAGALQIVTVVEIAYEDVALDERSGRPRNDGYAVRIDVAVSRNRGSYGGTRFVWLRRKRHRRRRGRAGAVQRAQRKNRREKWRGVLNETVFHIVNAPISNYEGRNPDYPAFMKKQ